MTVTGADLLKAYAVGIFPMAESADNPDIFWVDPPVRGILPLEDFHVPQRLARSVRSAPYTITFNKDFKGVIASCAASPRKEGKTWINKAIQDLYSELHETGFAHSVEAWHEEGLVGGLYGVSLGTAFFGESMFSAMRDASKIALVHLAARLIAHRFTLLDAQFYNPHLTQFGLQEIPREAYHQRLRLALSGAAFFADAGEVSPAAAGSEVAGFLQSRTHTS